MYREWEIKEIKKKYCNLLKEIKLQIWKELEKEGVEIKDAEYFYIDYKRKRIKILNKKGKTIKTLILSEKRSKLEYLINLLNSLKCY